MTDGDADAASDLKANIRFTNASPGRIRAWKGPPDNTYSHDELVEYKAGVKYYIRMEIDITSDIYDVFVISGENVFQEYQIANDYPFRSPAGQLNNFVIKMASTSNGIIDVCGPTVNFPTSTPTPGPWFKLKNASFTKLGLMENNVPQSVSQFDTIDDTTDPYLIINSPNNIPGVILVGNQGLPSQASSTNWVNVEGYNPEVPLTPSSFIAYVRSRKEYHLIPAIEDFNPDVIKGRSIYLFTGDLPLDQARENVLTTASADGPVVLLVKGDVTIESSPGFTVFNNNSYPFALVVDGTLSIDPAMTQLNGIFIANYVDFGLSSEPLKIVGNIISKTEADPSRRERTDLSKPSIFIVFNQQMYFSLIPYLSVATYEWKQVQ